MPWWYVVTPNYYYTEPILDDGSGPSYPTCDVVEVLAKNNREAIKAGVSIMLSTLGHKSWVHYQRLDGLCPYAGVKAERKYPNF